MLSQRSFFQIPVAVSFVLLCQLASTPLRAFQTFETVAAIENPDGSVVSIQHKVDRSTYSLLWVVDHDPSANTGSPVIHELVSAPCISSIPSTYGNFFEQYTYWPEIRLQPSQSARLESLKKNYENHLEEALESTIAQMGETSDGASGTKSLEIPQEHIERIRMELIACRTAAEKHAIDVLTTDQHRTLAKGQISHRGLSAFSLFSVWSVLGLDDRQAAAFNKLIQQFDDRHKKILAKSTKQDARKVLWEAALSHLTDSQKEQVQQIITDYRERIAHQPKARSIQDHYEIGGGSARSYIKWKDEKALVSDRIYCFRFDDNSKVVELELYDDSSNGRFGLDLDWLPLIGGSWYLWGIELTESQEDELDQIKQAFLEKAFDFLTRDEKSGTAGKVLGMGARSNLKKDFFEKSKEAHGILNNKQQQILLENRLGYEITTKGARAFLANRLCKELGLSGPQTTSIEEVIQQADQKFEVAEQDAKDRLAELEADTVHQIHELLNNEQRETFDAIR